MVKSKEITIWDKLQVVEFKEQPATEKSKKKISSDFNFKTIARLGKIFGLFFWIYASVHVFFIDIDRYLLGIIPSGIAFLVNYKFFIFLLITATFALFIEGYYLVYLYIILFPLIILLWEIPKIIYKFKSWILFLGLMEVISSFFYKFRYKIMLLTATLFAFLLIAISNSRPVLAFSVFSLMVVLILSLFWTAYSSFQAPNFLSFQSKIIKKFRNSGFTRSLILIDEKIKKSKSRKLTKEQSTIVLTNMQMALLFHRSIYFWAYQLEKYRESRVGFILGGISYVWLFVKLVFFLSFMNYGLYKINPGDFYTSNASFFSFINYSINSLFFSETSQLLAIGNIPLILRILSGLIGYIVLGTLILSFFYKTKQMKEDKELTEAIKVIKAEGRELGEQIKGEYSVSTFEAIERLQEFKAGMLKWILTISSQLPDDYME